MDYKPYSQEWHRKRYLKEAIDKYLDDYVDPTVIMDDLRDVLHARSEVAYQEFNRINQLEHYLSEEYAVNSIHSAWVVCTKIANKESQT